MAKRPLESDWKIFRKSVPEWRERYLAKKNQEIVGILTAENATATELFWKTKERINKESEILVTCLDGHSRSKMTWHLFLMYGHGLVQDADLEAFSEDLREHILKVSQNNEDSIENGIQ